MLINHSGESTPKIQNENPSTNLAKGSYEFLKSIIGQNTGRGHLDEPYFPLGAIIEKSDLRTASALTLLQYHGYRDCDGNWSDQIMNAGYVAINSYIATEESWGLKSRYRKELLSPDAQDLFTAFFAEATMD